MKVIAYSIFKAPCEKFEFMAYLRGIYFNVRMNRLIYPEWKTWVYIQDSVYNKYENFFYDLSIDRIDVMGEAPMCESMLWRMRPVFADDVSHVICRDADAITTYKEAQAVQEWLDSEMAFHGMTDNPAHSLPMMGGMIGIKQEAIRKLFPKTKDFNGFIKGVDLSTRGSDQYFMMKHLYPVAGQYMMGHFFEGCKEKVFITRHSVSNQIPGVDPKLWESNLTCRHIGSAGVVDMEVLRFFKRFDKTDYSEFEKEHSEICYWQR